MDKEKKCNHENCNCEKEELATIVTFTDDDGKEIDFQYIHSIEKDGKKYGAFEPLEELPEEEAGIVILEITKEDIKKAANYAFSGKPIYSIVASERTLSANKQYLESLNNQ